ncbi:Holliday junction branch migration protein RuvA [Cuneatibacter caecimuris]|uniref:Holliday junction branch migration complex subunit RuvA n=1 Tax=Cuneatibacter caecimuris TaxID=1796618 RepID=A0A4Q7PP38_9FIRM|nr:Holliday junction branch migration protein RuvA [Cuneatibacter caecimuris]RZT02026.1 Holliday junction DNA helicase subunit RuvA [Cuneatibacter caecimuris]
MIGYIKGELTEVLQDSVLIENQGTGWQIYVPGALFQSLPPIGSKIKLYTYLQVKEDGVSLFGFYTRDDLEIFKMLISVSGIGPKGALGVLSVMTPDDLRFAVLSDDAKAISKAPGIGHKTAQKVILELKDKLKLEDAFEKKLSHQTAAAASTDAVQEAVLALTALGYANSEALRAVRQVDGGAEMDVESLLKAALKQMSF